MQDQNITFPNFSHMQNIKLYTSATHILTFMNFMNLIQLEKAHCFHLEQAIWDQSKHLPKALGFCILRILFPSNFELFCILRIPRRLLYSNSGWRKAAPKLLSLPDPPSHSLFQHHLHLHPHRRLHRHPHHYLHLHRCRHDHCTSWIIVDVATGKKIREMKSPKRLLRAMPGGRKLWQYCSWGDTPPSHPPPHPHPPTLLFAPNQEEKEHKCNLVAISGYLVIGSY